jgi:hypothetical protein
VLAPVRTSFLALCITTTSLVLGAGAVALAQAVSPDDILNIRPRSVDDASSRGVPFGGFLISPGVEVSTLFDDNIFRTGDDRVFDVVTDVKPGLSVQSNWNRHSLFFGAEGDFGFYRDGSREDYVDYGYIASARYDIARETYLDMGFLRRRQHLGLGAVGDAGANQDGSFTTTTEEVGFTRALSYIQLKLFGRQEKAAYSWQGGAAEYGERGTRSLDATLSLEYMPDNDLFISVTRDFAEYDLLGGGDRRAIGTDLRGGLHFDTGGLFGGSLFGGRMLRSYNDISKDSDHAYLGGALDWRATPLTTFSLAFDTAFLETTETGSAGALHTTRRLDARHSFTPFVSGDMSFGVDDDDYISSTSTAGRETRSYYAGAGVKYEITEGLGARLDYDYRQRVSEKVADEYENNRVLFSLTYMH